MDLDIFGQSVKNSGYPTSRVRGSNEEIASFAIKNGGANAAREFGISRQRVSQITMKTAGTPLRQSQIFREMERRKANCPVCGNLYFAKSKTCSKECGSKVGRRGSEHILILSAQAYEMYLNGASYSEVGAKLRPELGHPTQAGYYLISRGAKKRGEILPRQRRGRKPYKCQSN